MLQNISFASVKLNKGDFNHKRKFFLMIATPTILMTAITTLIPLLMIVKDSFQDKLGVFTLNQYIKTFTDTYFLSSLQFTIIMSFLVTVVSIIISFPIAYMFARKKWMREHLFGFVTVPRMLPFFAIAYSLILLLAPVTGLVNTILVNDLKLLSKPLNILFSPIGLGIGLLYLRTVLCISMLTGIIQEINPNFELAAKSLGASSFTTFTRIVLPLSTPGIIAAGSLAFSETVAAYSIPLMLTGRGIPMISILLRTQLLFLRNHNLAYAQAIIVTIVSIICVLISKKALER